MSASKKSQIMASKEEFDIPQFPCGMAMFERILVFRIPSKEEKSETFGEGSTLIKVKERISNDIQGTPRCVLVSAGLRAMDILRANGALIGDVVWIAPDVFTRYEVGFSGGRAVEFSFCNVGDIITNESLAARLTVRDDEKKTKMQIAWDPEKRRHVVIDVETGLDMGHEQPRHLPDET